MASFERLAHIRQHLRPDQSLPRSSAEQVQTSATSHDRLLKGKVAIITGSGQGLGAEAAKLFAEHGAKVVVSDIDANKAEQTASLIRENGGEALVVAGDVTAEEFPKKIITAALNKFGGIDILINNAGFTWDGMIHKISPKQWEAMLAVHCTAPFRLIQNFGAMITTLACQAFANFHGVVNGRSLAHPQAAAPHFRETAKKEIEESGRPNDRCIINVSSTTGSHGNTGQANYATAKAGVLGLTKTVAKEWGSFGVRCNAVTYGLIATRLTGEKGAGSIKVNGEEVQLGIPNGEAFTQMAAEMAVPLKRVGTPKEAAGAMLLLASPYATFISGQSLEVTGGAFI